MLLGACALVGRWNEEMRRTRRRQVVGTTRWSKVRSIACAVFLELSDVGVMWSQVGYFGG